MTTPDPRDPNQTAPAQHPYQQPDQQPDQQPYQQPDQQSGEQFGRYPGAQYGHYPYGPGHHSEYYPAPAPALNWQQPPAPAAPAAPVKGRRRGLIAAGSALVLAAATVTGVALATGGGGSITGSGAALLPSIQGGGSSSGSTGGSGSGATGGSGSGSTGGSTGGSGSGGTSTSAGIATAAQQKGIVTIVSVLKYQNAESAGTGMILSSSGEILTNNHVINGATSITVTVETTGKSYRADVVGTVPTKDVAVLKLRNASGLQTANVGDSSDVAVGDAVTGVGNAGGTGTLRAASGKVTALNQAITATDETGSSSERLTGLIGINANIISGDSGGPLYDAAGEIIGMNTAASSSSGQGQLPGGITGGSGGTTGGGADSTGSSAYAIAIDNAEQLAKQIEAGQESSTVHIGATPFIGVGVTDANGAGAGITSVLDGGPAADAGIAAGSVITRVDGKSVTSADTLKAALATHNPGDSVTITWTDANGASHSAKVTLTTGPAD